MHKVVERNCCWGKMFSKQKCWQRKSIVVRGRLWLISRLKSVIKETGLMEKYVIEWKYLLSRSGIAVKWCYFENQCCWWRRWSKQKRRQNICSQGRLHKMNLWGRKYKSQDSGRTNWVGRGKYGEKYLMDLQTQVSDPMDQKLSFVRCYYLVSDVLVERFSVVITWDFHRRTGRC